MQWLYRKTSNDKEVVAFAKSLIKTWKKFVPEPADRKDRKKSEKSEKESKSSNEDQVKKQEHGKSFPARSVPIRNPFISQKPLLCYCNYYFEEKISILTSLSFQFSFKVKSMAF